MPAATAYTQSGTAWSDTYLTDPELVKALGPFDLDPACPPTMPWATAYRMFHHPAIDGLTEPWLGRIWINPPYKTTLVNAFMRKFVEHGSGIALLNSRSMNTWATQHAMAAACAVFLPARRLQFYKEDGEACEGKWFGQVLIGMNTVDAYKLSLLPDHGFSGVLLKGPRG